MDVCRALRPPFAPSEALELKIIKKNLAITHHGPGTPDSRESGEALGGHRRRARLAHEAGGGAAVASLGDLRVGERKTTTTLQNVVVD